MSKRELDKEIDDLWVRARALNGKATGISDRQRISDQAHAIRPFTNARASIFFGALSILALIVSVILIFAE